MRILIDECLSVSMVELATNRGHEAYHAAWHGWAGLGDHQLFRRAAEGTYVVATNNRRDFTKLARQVDLHAGMIILLPNVRRERQLELFALALAAAEQLPSMINMIVEFDEDGVPRVFQLPPL